MKVVIYMLLVVLACLDNATAFKMQGSTDKDATIEATLESPPELGGRRRFDPRKQFKCSSPKGLGLYQLGSSGCLFVSPGKWLIRTPIWSRYDDTTSQWYWTPFTFNDVRSFVQMWIPVSQDRVPANIRVTNIFAYSFLAQKPVPSNVKIIQYLNKESPHPSSFRCAGHPIATTVTMI